MKPSINAALLLTSHADTLVESGEGLRLVPYKDGNGIWTNGYGHTGPDVVPGVAWTKEQAIAALVHDLLTADNDILRDVLVALNQNEFDALVSFDFNVGDGHLRASTVLRDLNAGNKRGAADAMLMWDEIAGRVSPGLLKRRQAERALFLTPCAVAAKGDDSPAAQLTGLV
jgi:lysozyme